MQVFRELFLRGEAEALDALVSEIGRSLTDGWVRDTDAEDNLRSGSVNGRRTVACFACSRRGRRPAATLFLIQKDPNTVYVANIVPHDKSELSHDEYNTILEEFFRQFVEPRARPSGVQADLTESQADLEQWLSPTAAQKLRLFCGIANKRTGSSHPVDRERWYDFIRSVHEEGAELSSSTLARWLHEVGGWDDELAEKLAVEYEFARGLLAFSARSTVGA